ncbi:hypothetical protein SCUCBS95973_002316 [Sporothrix curviconia]|uniref:Xylanolytic transcriptional activator regulatory domain-containing protein n=1 Tax=Sporothrix curviconia TaxID=1260050 RepID=A0ABP0B661_9PEZI
MLLLAYYEIANALFPTAYMTVGTCARLGQIIGIHSNPDAVRTTVKKFSQHDDEERLRAWWATLILDRYVTIGLDDRPFVCRTARPDDYLPMDDQVWDRGETTFRPALALSTDMTASSNPFAHTCQAAHLLSHVLRHTNDTRPVTPEDYEAFYAEGMQLQKLVESFTYALWTVVQDAVAAAALSRIQHPDIADHPAYSPISLFPAFAIALSAQLCFYDVHVCADIDHPRAKGLASQQKMQMSALDGVKAVLKPSQTAR